MGSKEKGSMASGENIESWRAFWDYHRQRGWDAGYYDGYQAAMSSFGQVGGGEGRWPVEPARDRSISRSFSDSRSVSRGRSASSGRPAIPRRARRAGPRVDAETRLESKRYARLHNVAVREAERRLLDLHRQRGQRSHRRYRTRGREEERSRSSTRRDRYQRDAPPRRACAGSGSAADTRPAPRAAATRPAPRVKEEEGPAEGAPSEEAARVYLKYRT